MSDPLEHSFQAPPPPQAVPVEPPAPRPVKLRPIAIGLFVLGLIVLVGGIAKFISGGIQTGAVLCVWGLAMFGLSYIRLPKPVDDEPPMSPIAKLAGVFYEPTRVFRNVRSHTSWWAPFIAISIVTAVYTFAFTQRLTPERIVNFRVDKVAEMPPPFTPPPDRIEAMRTQQLEDAKSPVQRVGEAVRIFGVTFLFSCLGAALTFLAVLVFGGRINFWQALAVVFFTDWPFVAIQKIISLVILFIKDPDDIHPIRGQETLVQDNLGVLFSPSDHPVLFIAATFIGLLSLYWLWLRAKGLQNGGTRVSSGAAWGGALTLWLLLFVLALTAAALFPTFIG